MMNISFSSSFNLEKYLRLLTIQSPLEADDATLLFLFVCWIVYYLQNLLSKPDPSQAIWFERPQKDRPLLKAVQERNIAKLLNHLVQESQLL